MAANLAAAAGQELPGELLANPLLQCCFEALADPRPEVQDCAAASLGQVCLKHQACKLEDQCQVTRQTAHTGRSRHATHTPCGQ